MDTSAPYKIKIIGRPPLHTYMKTKKLQMIEITQTGKNT